MTHAYTADGVNVAAGDSFSSYAGKACKATTTNNPHVIIHDMTAGKFRGPRGYDLTGFPDDILFTTVNDGIGTKVELHDAAKTYTQAARDVVAMTGSDITRYGGCPLVFTSVLDVASIGEPGSASYAAAQGLIDGLVEVAGEQQLVVFNGETAELGDLIGTHNPQPTLAFNWAGTMEGVYHPDKMILGDKIQDGDIVIALKEQGFRSNGISSVRKAFAMQFGEHRHTASKALDWLPLAAAPSIIYDRLLSYLNGWTTPGHESDTDAWYCASERSSFEGKLLDDVLAGRGLEVTLDNLYNLPDVMRECANRRSMDDADVYRTRHGGQGMLVFASEHDVDTFISTAKEYGIQAQAAGTVKATSGASRVVIDSMFTKGEKVVFEE